MEKFTIMSFSPISQNEVKSMFTNLPTSGACDIDFLSTRLIKNFSTELSYPLSIVINHSFENGYFSNDLKTSKIMSFNKTGDTKDPKNKRPIGILPVFSKFFKRAMHVQIAAFFYK